MSGPSRCLTDRYVSSCAISGLLRELHLRHQEIVLPLWKGVEEVISQNSMYLYGETSAKLIAYAYDPSDRVYVFLNNTMDPKREAIESMFWIEGQSEAYQEIIDDLLKVQRKLTELRGRECAVVKRLDAVNFPHFY